MILNGETTKIKIVDLKTLWNFIVDNFDLKSSYQEKVCSNFQNFEI